MRSESIVQVIVRGCHSPLQFPENLQRDFNREVVAAGSRHYVYFWWCRHGDTALMGITRSYTIHTDSEHSVQIFKIMCEKLDSNEP